MSLPAARTLAAVAVLASLSDATGQTAPQSRPAAASRPAPARAVARPERRAPTTVPVNLGRARQEVERARYRSVTARQQIERAVGNRAEAQRQQGYADWRRALDEVRPTARRLDPDVPAQREILADYQALRAEYAEAAGLGNLGGLFLGMQRRWSELTRPYENWAQESDAAAAAAATRPAAEAEPYFGRPQTLAFVRAADQYQRDVHRMPAYVYFDDAPEVTNDLAQARAAREKAAEAYNDAARRAVDKVAADETSDDASRERLQTLIDRDLPDDVVEPETLAKAESLLHARDVAAHGEQRAVEMRRERMAADADVRWAVIRARYGEAPTLDDPQTAQRDELVTLSGFENKLGGQFRSDEYDLAIDVARYPVVMRFDPALKRQYRAAMDRAGLKTLPAGTTYEVIGRPVGTAKVEEMVAPGNLAVRAATQPTPGNSDATIEIRNLPASRPTMSDAIVLDVYALRAGPIAIGVDPPMP